MLSVRCDACGEEIDVHDDDVTMDGVYAVLKEVVKCSDCKKSFPVGSRLKVAPRSGGVNIKSGSLKVGGDIVGGDKKTIFLG